MNIDLKHYVNINRPLTLITRGGVEVKVLCKLDNVSIYLESIGEGKRINTDYVTTCKGDFEHDPSMDYVIHDDDLNCIKQELLNDSIRHDLLLGAVGFKHYLKHYKEKDHQLVIYCLKHYDLRQENGASIIGLFEQIPHVDTRPEIVHKLKGLSIRPNYFTGDPCIVTTTVEAWRYHILRWDTIQKLCPEFISVVTGQ